MYDGEIGAVDLSCLELEREAGGDLFCTGDEETAGGGLVEAMDRMHVWPAVLAPEVCARELPVRMESAARGLGGLTGEKRVPGCALRRSVYALDCASARLVEDELGGVQVCELRLGRRSRGWPRRGSSRSTSNRPSLWSRRARNGVPEVPGRHGYFRSRVSVPVAVRLRVFPSTARVESERLGIPSCACAIVPRLRTAFAPALRLTQRASYHAAHQARARAPRMFPSLLPCPSPLPRGAVEQRGDDSSSLARSLARAGRRTHPPRVAYTRPARAADGARRTVTGLCDLPDVRAGLSEVGGRRGQISGCTPPGASRLNFAAPPLRASAAVLEPATNAASMRHGGAMAGQPGEMSVRPTDPPAPSPPLTARG